MKDVLKVVEQLILRLLLRLCMWVQFRFLPMLIRRPLSLIQKTFEEKLLLGQKQSLRFLFMAFLLKWIRLWKLPNNMD